MRPHATLSRSFFVAAFLLFASVPGSIEATDWQLRAGSSVIDSEKPLSEAGDKAEVNRILKRKGYADLTVLGGLLAWGGPKKGLTRTVYFKANCTSSKGGTATAEGWIDYLDEKKFALTRVIRAK